MSLEIKGLNNLIKKLDNLSNMKTDDIVQEVAEDMQKKLQEKAREFSDTEYKCIRITEKRTYKNGSCFIDVGLKNDEVPFDNWKGLWYHQWGYRQYFFGHDTGKMTTMHQLWFDEGIEEIAKETKQKMRAKIKAKMNIG